jgi:hypothetical protein
MVPAGCTTVRVGVTRHHAVIGLNESDCEIKTISRGVHAPARIEWWTPTSYLCRESYAPLKPNGVRLEV